jgi:ABC-type dipeptide/oligopeptide/nickel transport system permease component
MSVYVARRLVQSLIVLLGISVVVFVILHLTGDPTLLMLPPDASAEEVARFRKAMGFDDPLPVQYWRFLRGVLHGNFGNSLRHDEPALGLVFERMPATLELTVVALAVALLLAIPAGIVSAVFRNTALDYVSTVVALIGQAMPTFWLGIMLILVFAVSYRLVPVSGRDNWRSLILPAVCLGVYLAPVMMRLVRSGMLEVLRQDYIRTARAKGVADRGILWKHAFKNVSIPLVTMIGLQFGRLLAGTVVIEVVFAWPGIGWLTVKAVRTLDYPVVQASVVVLGAGIALVNLLTDLVIGYLDPRIRHR